MPYCRGAAGNRWGRSKTASFRHLATRGRGPGEAAATEGDVRVAQAVQHGAYQAVGEPGRGSDIQGPKTLVQSSLRSALRWRHPAKCRLLKSAGSSRHGSLLALPIHLL